MRTVKDVVAQTLALTAPFSGAREASRRLISLDKDMLLATPLGNLAALHNTFESTRHALQYYFRNLESRLSPQRYAQIVRHTRSMPRFFRESACVLNMIADSLATSNSAVIAEHGARLINALCMHQRKAQRALESVRTLLHAASLPKSNDPDLDELVDFVLGPSHNLAISESLNGRRTSWQPGTAETDYKVFISHAGEEKHSIARPLWRRLQDKNIRTFLDETELRVGDNAPFRMEMAMETADICIVILSPEYVAKKWPMKELECFLRRRKEADDIGGSTPVLIPVFYRLPVSECGQDRVFQSIDSQGQRIFFRWGFFEREARKETSVLEVLRLLQELKCRTGIENHHNATNETTQDAHEKRQRLLDDVTKAIEEAHAGLPPSPSIMFPPRQIKLTFDK